SAVQTWIAIPIGRRTVHSGEHQGKTASVSQASQIDGTDIGTILVRTVVDPAVAPSALANQVVPLGLDSPGNVRTACWTAAVHILCDKTVPHLGNGSVAHADGQTSTSGDGIILVDG